LDVANRRFEKRRLTFFRDPIKASFSTATVRKTKKEKTKMKSTKKNTAPKAATKKAAPKGKAAKAAPTKAAPTKAAPAKAAKAAPAPTAPTPRTTKKGEAIELLKKGIALDDLMTRFGWQRHTVRGFMSILGKTHTIESTSVEGVRTYKIAGGK
jgi:hypothetical protein